MKNNKLILLIGISIILGGIFFFLSKKSDKVDSGSDITAGIFSALDIESIKGIKIEDADNSVLLSLKEDIWTVESLGGYPADYGKIHELVFSLTRLSPGQVLTKRKELYNKFGLNAPPEKDGGSVVFFLGVDGNELMGIILGKEREAGNQKGGSGQYIRFMDRDEVFLIGSEINAQAEGKSWLKKELTKVKEEEIESIVIEHGDERENIVLKRAKREDELKLEGDRPTDKELKNYEISSIGSVLQNLMLESVYSENDSDLKKIDFNITYIASLFNGSVYRIESGEKDKKFYIKIGIDYITPLVEEKEEKEPGKEGENEGEDKQQPELFPEEMEAKVMESNTYFSGWVYEIPSYSGNKLAKKRSELFEERKEETE